MAEYNDFMASVDKLKAVMADLVTSFVPVEYAQKVADVSDAIDALAVAISSSKE